MVKKGRSEYCERPGELKTGEKCFCEGCRARRARYQRDWRYRQALRSHGKLMPYDRIDPEPSTKALWHARQTLGRTFREISRNTGLNLNTITRIYEQDVKWVWRQTEERILEHYGPEAYERRNLLPKTYVQWAPHRWKINALQAQGWTLEQLAEMVKASDETNTVGGWVKNTRARRTEHIQYKCLQDLEWLVEKIGDRKGPSSRAVTAMTKKGAFPLIHYTEEGKLIRGSLTPEQRDALKRVQSTHGKARSRSHGSRSRTGPRRSS